MITIRGRHFRQCTVQREGPPAITADGKGVVWRAGTLLLSELADRIGLTAAPSEATGGGCSRNGKINAVWT